MLAFCISDSKSDSRSDSLCLRAGEVKLTEACIERTHSGPGLPGIPVKGSQRNQDNDVMNRFFHFHEQEMTEENKRRTQAQHLALGDIANSQPHSLPFISFYIKTEPLVDRLRLPSHTVLQG